MPEHVEVQGVKEIERKLKELERKTARQFLRTALREGAKPILAQAKSEAPERTGQLRKAIKIRSGGTRNGVISILVAMGKKFFQGKAFYGSFQEFGHFTGKRLRGKQFKGEEGKARYHAESLAAGRTFIPGKHFLQHAYDSHKQSSANVSVEKLKQLIEGEAGK